MSKYEDIIPFLQREYEKVKDNLDSSIELNEDKIPRPLYRAYTRTHWNDNGTTRAQDVASTYGDRSQSPDHNVLKNNKDAGIRGRRNMLWDLGKAHFNKMSKQEAVDFLGMKIYKGRKKSELEEISINDPIPEDFKIELTGDLAKNNINKLRFLVKSDSDDWKLTEFEYRAKVASSGKVIDQFFPIFRDYFQSSKLDQLGIPYRSNGSTTARIKDLNDWSSINTVYYAIKLADLIYETDEYEHPLGLKNEYETWLNNNDKLSQETRIKWYLSLGIINKYINKVCTKYNLDKDTIVNNALRYAEDTAESVGLGFISKYGDELNNVSTDTLFKMITEVPANSFYLASNSFNYSTKKIFNDFLHTLSDEQRKWCINNLQQLFEADLAQLENMNVDNQLFEIQDLMLDELPDGRLKNVWVRRVHNDRIKNTNKNKSNQPVGAGLEGNVDFTPYNTYKNRSINVKHKDIPDTGFHINPSTSISDYSRFDINSLDSNTLQAIKYYVEALRNKGKYKRRYILAYNAYNEFKNQENYFASDDPEYYEKTLEYLKGKYLDAKANYIGGENSSGEEITGIIEKIKKYEKSYRRELDEQAYRTNTLINNHLAYLQGSYKKLLILRKLIRDISAYTEEDFRTLYGFENKEEFDKIIDKLTDLLISKRNQEEAIVKFKQKISDLQQQLNSLLNDLGSAETNLDQLNAEITEVQKQREQLSTGIESSIRKAYKDQAEFNQLADNLDQDIRNHRYQDKKSANKINAMDPKKKEADDRLLDLIQEFGNGNKDLAIDDEPSEDDILSDDDEIDVNLDTDTPKISANTD